MPEPGAREQVFMECECQDLRNEPKFPGLPVALELLRLSRLRLSGIERVPPPETKSRPLPEAKKSRVPAGPGPLHGP